MDNIFYRQFPFVKLLALILSIYKYGIIIGIIAFIVLKYSYEKLIELVYGLKAIKAADRMFLFLEDRYRFNIISAFEFKNNLDVNKFLDLFHKRLEVIPRLRQTLKAKFLDFWWKEMDVDTAKKSIKFKIVTDFPIKTRQDLYFFMEREEKILFDLENELPYKFIVISNKNNQNGDVLLFKFDHIFSDGLGYISLLFGMADNFSSKDFPLVIKFSIVDKVKAYLFMPFYIIKCFYNVFFKCDSGNTPLKNSVSNRNITGRSNKTVSKCFLFSEYYPIFKELGITFNDFIIGIFSKSFKNYYENDLRLKNYSKTISALLTVGTRNIPDSSNDLILENDSTGTSFSFPIIDDPLNKKQLLKIKENINYFIKDWALTYNIRFITDFFATFLNKYCFMALSNKSPQDFIFTNLPGPKKALVFAGNELLDVISHSTPGLNMNFLGLITYNDKIRIMSFTDECTKRSSRDIIKNIEEVLVEVYQRKFGKLPTIID